MKRSELKSLINEIIEESKLHEEAVDASLIDPKSIKPEQKDYDRADSMSSLAKATSQANAIKDPVKLIRRLKAVLEVKGDEFIQPFLDVAATLGFSDSQIAEFTSGKTERKEKVENAKIKYDFPSRKEPYAILPVGIVDTTTGNNNEKTHGWSFNIYDDWGKDCYAELWGKRTVMGRNPKVLDKPVVTRVIASSWDAKMNDKYGIDAEPTMDKDGNPEINILIREFKHDQTWAYMGETEFIKIIKMSEVKTDPLTMGKKVNCSTYK